MAGWLLPVLCLLFCALPLHADWKEAAAVSAKHRERALIIWENGRIVQERYSNGGAPDKAENIYSITKTLCALSTLSALGRGKLQLDALVGFPEWQNDPLRRGITVRNLLDQTSGLSPGYDVLYSPDLKNKDAAAIRLPARASSGTSFAYGPAHYEVLEVLLDRTLQESPADWVRKSLLAPLSISPSGWRHDPAGRIYFSAGAFLTARDLLRVAHLVRRQGWNGLFPLIPATLLRQALSGSAANPMYGFGFWLNRNASASAAVEADVERALQTNLSSSQWAHTCLSTDAPADLVAMVGSYGQRVYITPSRGSVIVRLGQGGGFNDPEFLRAYFR